MNSKTCTKCGKTSYSSKHEGEWKCPYCGEDLSEVEINKNKSK